MKIEEYNPKEINKLFNTLMEADAAVGGVADVPQYNVKDFAPGKDFFSRIFQTYDVTMEAMGNGILSSTKSVKDSFTSLKDTINYTRSTMASGARTIGNAANTAANTVNNGINAVGNAANAVGNTVNNGINAVSGIANTMATGARSLGLTGSPQAAPVPTPVNTGPVPTNFAAMIDAINQNFTDPNVRVQMAQRLSRNFNPATGEINKPNNSVLSNITSYVKNSEPIKNLLNIFESDPSNKGISGATGGGKVSGFVSLIKNQVSGFFETMTQSNANGSGGALGFIWNFVKGGFEKLGTYVTKAFGFITNFLEKSGGIGGLFKKASDLIKGLKMGALPLPSILVWVGGASVFALILHKVVKWFKKRQDRKGYTSEGYYDITSSDLNELNKEMLSEDMNNLTEASFMQTIYKSSKPMITDALTVDQNIANRQSKTFGDHICSFFNLIFKLVLVVALLGILGSVLIPAIGAFVGINTGQAAPQVATATPGV
jgi:hypothetical protein